MRAPLLVVGLPVAASTDGRVDPESGDDNILRLVPS